ncbi:MAG TPA: hypothetical protein VI039_06705 [Solirubrobacterales bacterium]
MKLHVKLVSSLAVLALGLVPATGLADGVNYAPEGPKKDHPAHPTHPATPKGNAYGKYCKGQSKEHVKGEKGTAFSRCVQAMARADRNDELTARKACQTLSKKHVKGEKGTPFSNCVKGVAQMRKDKAEDETQS